MGFFEAVALDEQASVWVYLSFPVFLLLPDCLNNESKNRIFLSSARLVQSRTKWLSICLCAPWGSCFRECLVAGRIRHGIHMVQFLFLQEREIVEWVHLASLQMTASTVGTHPLA